MSMAEQPQPTASSEEAARKYAWEWFSYHASQRQTVFRFFLILVGAIIGGYLAVLKSPDPKHLYLFGAALTVLSFLFWRLDVRSRTLINLAEAYLRVDEARLAQALNNDDIRISWNAHTARDSNSWLISLIYTFKQIYRTIFVLCGAVGLVIFFAHLKS
jgi:hypothetical protein